MPRVVEASTCLARCERMEEGWGSEKGTPLYLALIPAFTFPARYAWTERLKGGKDEKEGVREGVGVRGVEGGRREGDQRRWRDRLSCQAAVNSHRRDVEAGDFFCTSPLICASDYLNWLEQS